MSQQRLISSKRFLPFFLTQASGAFNDNVFKNALMLLLAFTAANALPWDTDLTMNLAAGLFILPFLSSLMREPPIILSILMPHQALHLPSDSMLQVLQEIKNMT